ncbi:hypothetical protein O6H91_14G058200 [Diphasiastrum complanatum]|uniref:Uncharacterized protein n=1 Tax=Diphasiastrum complanatum TaxID=34168 RepID=A0ACC2BQ00_DIPCM|nr:hypothetical protein O6H91_14G058200 [Diphasiastrum complanatum]
MNISKVGIRRLPSLAAASRGTCNASQGDAGGIIPSPTHVAYLARDAASATVCNAGIEASHSQRSLVESFQTWPLWRLHSQQKSLHTSRIATMARVTPLRTNHSYAVASVEAGIPKAGVFTKSSCSDYFQVSLRQSKEGNDMISEQVRRATFSGLSSFSRIERSKLTTPCAANLVQRRTFACEQSNEQETISVTFVDKDGDEKIINAPIGISMLEAAHENDVELEGACEGSLACSTCHVIVMDEDYYGKLPEPADEENDMLDLAFGLTETSRLGCQVIAKPELDGMRLALPAATRNFAVDGHVPKPH